MLRKTLMKFVFAGSLVGGVLATSLTSGQAVAQNAQWNALFDRIIRLEARVKNMPAGGRVGQAAPSANNGQMQLILREIRQMRQQLLSMDARLRRLEKNSGRSGKLRKRNVPQTVPRQVTTFQQPNQLPKYPRQATNNQLPFAPTQLEQYDVNAQNGEPRITVEYGEPKQPLGEPVPRPIRQPAGQAPTNWQTGSNVAPSQPPVFQPPARAPGQVVGLPPQNPLGGNGVQRGTLDGNQVTQASVGKRLIDRASSDLRSRRYASAEAGFKSFLTKYPSDKMASNAQFMLGETYYVQKNYRRAAQTFLKGYRKYPNGRKAGATLLKLGMSLSKLGQKPQSCAAFEAVTSKYKKSTGVARQAKKEMKRARC